MRRLRLGSWLLAALLLAGALAALWVLAERVPLLADAKREATALAHRLLGDRLLGEGAAERDALPPIRIAFAGDLSGAGAQSDRMILDGIDMYVQDLLASGGLAGRQIAVETFDDQGDPLLAARVAARIAADDGILAVIGHGGSAAALAAAAVYRREGLPFIAPTASDPEITRDNPWAFRVIFTDALQAKVLANYIRSVLGYESTAIIAETGAYAQTLVEAFTAAAAEIALNTSPIFAVSERTTEVQLNDIVRRIALMSRLESILLVMRPEAAETLIPLLRAAGTRADIIGSDALSQVRTGDGERPAGPFQAPTYMEDVLLTLPFVPDTASSEARAFLDDYQSQQGKPAGWPALFGYDAAQLLGAAVARLAPGTLEEEAPLQRRALRAALSGMNVPEAGTPGLTGLLYVNEQGDVIRPVYLGRVSRGEMVAAAQQLQIIDDPEMVEVLREEGENTIEVEDVFLQVTQVVRTGIQLQSIDRIDPVANSFAATFNLWFRYTGAFDPDLVEFPDAVEPIALGEPKQTLDLGREVYTVFEVSGTFAYTPGVDSLRTAHQAFPIRYRHSQRDITRLIFLPDLRAMQARPDQGGWAAKLRKDGVIDASSGWVIDSASVSQEIENESTRGNPLIPTVEIPFSSFLASVEAFQGELSLRRQLEGAVPPEYRSWLSVLVLTAVIAVTFLPSLRSRFFAPIFLVRLALTAVVLSLVEDLFFEAYADKLEIFELANIVDVFSALWWLMPAIWLVFLVKRAVWERMEKRTGHPVPSIVKNTVNVAIVGVAVICVMNFVLGFTVTSIWAASGVVTVILGIALQTLILDAATGLMINMEQPFRIGDWIRTADGVKGRVQEMNWRTTRVRTFSNDLLIVPNSVVGSTVLTNYNSPDNITGLEIRLRLEFSVPVRRACALLVEAALDAARQMPSIVTEPPPEANVVSMDQYGPLYVLQVNFDVSGGEWDQVNTAVVDCVQRRLAEAGLAVPLPP